MSQSFCGIICYVALFSKVENEMFFVEFPDLPGCYTQGSNIGEAICRAREALAIYYEEKNGNLPSPSPLEQIQKEASSSFAQIIAIDASSVIVKSLKTVKKTLTIPEWLNVLSEKYKVNFSQVLKAALINYLSNLDSISPYDKRMLKD